MSLKQTIKEFLKHSLFNESHPYFMMKMLDRREKKMLAQQEAHSRMTYAQIEAAIDRQAVQMFGRPVNWENPQTYNDKIHVSKLYMPTPLKTRLADKYAVREWIAEKIGSEYLIPLLGVYDSFDEIDFDALPEQFVIKCNHDSGSYTLVKDKSKINRKLLKRKYEVFMRQNFAWMGWEMHYREIPPKIMIEQYMGDEICDYKFMCFGGKVYYCQVAFNLATSPGAYTRNFYDVNWNVLQCYCIPTPMDNKEHECPEEWHTMLQLAEKLAEGFDQVRADLCLIDGKIYFGEMTFADGCGFAPFVPDEYDYKFGALWPFDTSIRSQVLARSSRP